MFLMAATLLAALSGLPALGWAPATLLAGLRALDSAGLAALGLGLAFSLLIVLGERRLRDRKFLGRRARGGSGVTLRSLLVILGASGLIVGALAVLNSVLMAVLPHIASSAPLPLTFPLAVPMLLVGGLVYVAGRFERY